MDDVAIAALAWCLPERDKRRMREAVRFWRGSRPTMTPLQAAAWREAERENNNALSHRHR